MKSIYGSAEMQGVFANKIQEPLKRILVKVADGRSTLRDIYTMFHVYRAMKNLPVPTREQYRNPSTPIAIDARDDLFEHLNMAESYRKVFLVIINTAIGKCDFDDFYDGVSKHVFLYLLKRGWHLNGRTKPQSKLWHNIRPSIQNRLVEAISRDYQTYQDRLRKLDNDWAHNPEELERQKAMRYRQFIQHILDAVEVEVEMWKEDTASNQAIALNDATKGG